MSLIRPKVATAKKHIELLQKSKSKKRLNRPHVKMCACCGIEFSCALLRAMYCSSQCSNKAHSRQRERQYEQRKCRVCGKEITVRQDTDTQRCRECYKKSEAEFSKHRPRHAGGYFMPGVPRTAIELNN